MPCDKKSCIKLAYLDWTCPFAGCLVRLLPWMVSALCDISTMNWRARTRSGEEAREGIHGLAHLERCAVQCRQRLHGLCAPPTLHSALLCLGRWSAPGPGAWV